MCVGDVKEESRHLDLSTVMQGRGTLKIFLNLKCIFAPFVLFYYLHNYFKYKTLLFTTHSVVLIIVLGGTTFRRGGMDSLQGAYIHTYIHTYFNNNFFDSRKPLPFCQTVMLMVVDIHVDC